jgi:hypothetical protein
MQVVEERGAGGNGGEGSGGISGGGQGVESRSIQNVMREGGQQWQRESDRHTPPLGRHTPPLGMSPSRYTTSPADASTTNLISLSPVLVPAASQSPPPVFHLEVFARMRCGFIYVCMYVCIARERERERGRARAHARERASERERRISSNVMWIRKRNVECKSENIALWICCVEVPHSCTNTVLC